MRPSPLFLAAILFVAVALTSCVGLGIAYEGKFGKAVTNADGSITYTAPAKPIIVHPTK